MYITLEHRNSYITMEHTNRSIEPAPGGARRGPRPARAPLPSPHIRAPSPIAPTEFQKFETLRLFIVLCRFATKDKLFYRQLSLATLRKR